jgi:hypothetical protein
MTPSSRCESPEPEVLFYSFDPEASMIYSNPVSRAAAAFGYGNCPGESMAGVKYYLSHGATELTLDTSRDTLSKNKLIHS